MISRTLTGVITDPELAAAIRGRPHWEALGEKVAGYRPPGMGGEVRVWCLERPGGKHAYSAVLFLDGKPARSLQTVGPGEAVFWAERLRPAEG